MRRIIVTSILCLFSVLSYAECTGLVKIERLSPRDGGWVHITAEGMSDMDIMNCGANDRMGMLLNFNDMNGTLEGKKMLYSALLAAFSAGKKMQLCATGCDSQHPGYSRLSYISNLQ